ncbi:CYIR protein [Plasmodium cynomolgi strain B]|uniref:CYIR protein n=1 Tax=Plasmodium cynomolgi (strain B) TaxID=1120755 RepID=K6UNC2_PLACD|nr:CYIR protein [Plasmodium cynomolgi strain B]GAB69353.1 CYIR protein [Plasmodium cynomolgi strain B]
MCNYDDNPKERSMELINLCKRIACKYINLPNIVRSERNYYDRCSYFINWAQDVIKKHFKVDLASNYYYHFIFKLIDVARYISWEDLKSPPCQRLFDSDFRHWEVEKDIHDYFKNIDTLKSKIDTEADKRNSYLEYLTYIKDLYEKNYVECCDPYDVSYSNCPNYFICNPNFHPSELIAKIKPDTHVKRVIVGGQRGNPQLLSTVQALSATWTYNQNVRNASRGGDSSSLFFSSLFTGLNGAKRASKLQGKSYRYGVGGQDAYCPSGTTYDYRMHTCKTREGLSFRVVNYGKDYDPATLDNQIEYLDDIGILVPGSKGESPSKYSSFRLGLSCALGLIIIIVLYLFIKVNENCVLKCLPAICPYL